MHRRTRVITAAVIVSCVLATALAGPSLADSKDDLQRERNGVSGKIDGAKKHFAQSSKEYAAAATRLSKAKKKLGTAKDSLASTQDKLSAAQDKDAAMQAQLVATEEQLTQAQAELKTGKKDVELATNLVRQFTLDQLQSGDRGLRAFGDLLRGTSPMVFSEKLSLNESVSDAQVSKMQELDASRVMLKIRQDKVQRLRDEAAKQREEAANNLDQMETLEAEAQDYTDEINELVGERKGAERDAAREKAADAKKLKSLENDRERLNRELAELARKEQQAASRPSKGGGGGGGSGAGGGAAPPPSGGGGSTLSMPLRGNAPVTSPYGNRFHPVYKRWNLHDGTDFGAACGTPIYAAASGKVLEVYFNAGYGNRVVVSNGRMRGKSVVTTYNHMSRFAVSPGQNVKRGSTVLGYVGQTGYATGCHLHFMVIANGQTTNPMGWL